MNYIMLCYAILCSTQIELFRKLNLSMQAKISTKIETFFKYINIYLYENERFRFRKKLQQLKFIKQRGSNQLNASSCNQEKDDQKHTCEKRNQVRDQMRETAQNNRIDVKEKVEVKRNPIEITR